MRSNNSLKPMPLRGGLIQALDRCNSHLAHLTICIYTPPMEFTWSERKRPLNLKQHGLDFVDVPAVFGGLTFTFEDDRFSYKEQRFVTLGLLAGVPSQSSIRRPP